jgi:hypothetical protein
VVWRLGCAVRGRLVLWPARHPGGTAAVEAHGPGSTEWSIAQRRGSALDGEGGRGTGTQGRGRRVLVSDYWTGKTLTEHAADRLEAVRVVLEAEFVGATGIEPVTPRL